MKLIDNSIEELMNRTLQSLFEGNAIVDNLVYNLQDRRYFNLANALHEPIAHKLTSLADEVSDLMIKLGGRPVRYGMGDHAVKYEKVEDIFNVLYATLSNIRGQVIRTLSEAEMADNYEVKIFLEDFLNSELLPLIAQVDEWVRILAEDKDAASFDRHIEDYSHALDIDD